jgi:hypothetical protein
MVVRPEPAGSEVLDLGNGLEQILPQPVVAYRAVIALHIGVLLRLARLDVFEPDTPSLGPIDERRTDILRTIVAADRQGLAPPLDDLIQGSDHPLRGQREVHLDTESFTVEIIDHVDMLEKLAEGPISLFPHRHCKHHHSMVCAEHDELLTIIIRILRPPLTLHYEWDADQRVAVVVQPAQVYKELSTICLRAAVRIDPILRRRSDLSYSALQTVCPFGSCPRHGFGILDEVIKRRRNTLLDFVGIDLNSSHDRLWFRTG